jgi:hypothetical protein
MNNDKHVEFYQKLKNRLFDKYLFVSGSKSQIIDLTVYGIEEDKLYKVITPDIKTKVDSWVIMLQAKFKHRKLKVKYVLIYVDHDYNIISEKEILISS